MYYPFGCWDTTVCIGVLLVCAVDAGQSVHVFQALVEGRAFGIFTVVAVTNERKNTRTETVETSVRPLFTAKAPTTRAMTLTIMRELIIKSPVLAWSATSCQAEKFAVTSEPFPVGWTVPPIRR